jgi:membrane associated rhomboid family serine protease
MFEDFKHAFQRYNNAHVQLIIINVVIFLVIGVMSVVGNWTGTEWVADAVYNQFSIPPVLGEFLTRPWTLVTYMFAHSRWDISHILFNMLALYWFGSIFAEYLGSDKLVAMYVLGGLAGALVYLFMFNTVPFYIDRSLDFPGMVGASAAIYAIVVGAATLLPDYTFFLMFIGPVRIKYIAAFYVIASFLGTTQLNAGGNLAHLGGAMMGFIYIKQLQRGNNLGIWVTFLIQWFKNLFAPRRNVKVTYRKDTSSGRKPNKASAISQAEIDAILDKISDGGYESLTKEEKEKLFNASKK